ncbi:MAG: hypothetical protein AMQ22_02187 [Candidatus Methanofastidiosum methylothiophilum]|jgi:hypothetical protein|uniref:Uncharacterized protein n=1 Tax=Candidatus Methanofastidiosum methylothiophilum TaxID=1705564 RepID=A0A150ILX7_9EURY|nr:MAG: hypothetical protein AMQ22_02187 [Candidatus Methanofastidiosum methylthiophilus]
MKKTSVFLFAAVLLGELLFGESIPRKEYLGIIKTIEAFINKDNTFKEKEIYIFECERNDSFHSGYIQNEKGFYLGANPYDEMQRDDISVDETIVDISIDYNAKDIIIVFRKNGKWYGFKSRIISKKNRIRIKEIPKELNETD